MKKGSKKLSNASPVSVDGGSTTLITLKEQIIARLTAAEAGHELSSAAVQDRIALAERATLPEHLQFLIADLTPLAPAIESTRIVSDRDVPIAMAVPAESSQPAGKDGDCSTRAEATSTSSSAEGAGGPYYPPFPHGEDGSRYPLLSSKHNYFIGGAEYKGRMRVPRYLYVNAVIGGLELDLREAHFLPGETRFHISAMMGGVSIKLPPYVVLDDSSMVAVAGGLSKKYSSVPVPADAPRISLRITGTCICGGVEVKYT